MHSAIGGGARSIPDRTYFERPVGFGTRGMGRAVVQSVAGNLREGNGHEFLRARATQTQAGTGFTRKNDVPHWSAGKAGCTGAQADANATAAATSLREGTLPSHASMAARQHEPQVKTAWGICFVSCALVYNVQ